MVEIGDHVVVGVSGGADSVCLLFILLALIKEIPFTIEAAHINHLLRKEADEDMDFVKDLCEELGVPLRVFTENIKELAKKRRVGIEEAARDYRYACFNEAVSHNKGKIAVAHHQDDNAETVIFNLFRGSGLKGLSGISAVRDKIIRPLLCCNRREIEAYLECQKITYITDATNSEDIYARNRIRRHIIPIANGINSEAVMHIAKTAELIRETECYLQKHTKAAFNECATHSETQIAINLTKFTGYERLIQKRILLLAIGELSSECRDISACHVDGILKIIDGGGSRRVDLPGKIVAIKEYDTLVIINHTAEPHFKSTDIQITFNKIHGNKEEITIPDLGILLYFTFPYQKNENIPQKTYTKWFDYDKITSCLIFRRRKQDDYLIINQAGQHKRLKDYLINEKIPKAARDKLYVLADGSHIVWVPGLRISEEYKVTSFTETVLACTLKLNE
ncbi:MAG: tRNA lysidine(34) synthetase TilS [Lachnospiraceae bacterium]|nr:tRNA lysidine(34) synthetase TilS [Lachnospiraceae bacterium]